MGSIHDFYILVETMGSDASHDSEKLTRFLEQAMQDGVVENGTMATNVTEAQVRLHDQRITRGWFPDRAAFQAMWKVREGVTEALKHDGYVHKCDISLPLKHFYDMVVATRQRAGSLPRRVVGYGHLGDGNLHLNITETKRSAELVNK